MSARFVGGLLMAMGAAAMFLWIEYVVVAVPITLIVVGIASSQPTLVAADHSGLVGSAV